MHDFIPNVPDSELRDYDPTSAADSQAFFGRWRRERDAFVAEPQAPPSQPEETISFADAATDNPLRPTTFEGVIGQEHVKGTLRRLVRSALDHNRPLDHVLLVGASGTGKSTLALVLAQELGKRMVQLEAPISHDTLIQLQRIMRDGDILFIDEIHQQAIMERRGKSAATQPEVLFAVMEDRRLPTSTGVLKFPAITVIGATTDEGMLPDAFVNRFPIRPALEPYSEDDLVTIAELSADALGVEIDYDSALIFARASRAVPREINSYVRNARSLSQDRWVRPDLAREVLSFAGVTEDGLTRDMQATLRYLYTRCRRITGDNEVIYQASVNSIATAIGKSRDSKAVVLRVEPFLIQQGYLQVTHGGRRLTAEGVLRAIAL